MAIRTELAKYDFMRKGFLPPRHCISATLGMMAQHKRAGAATDAMTCVRKNAGSIPKRKINGGERSVEVSYRRGRRVERETVALSSTASFRRQV
jgi:hypothetical protein